MVLFIMDAERDDRTLTAYCDDDVEPPPQEKRRKGRLQKIMYDCSTGKGCVVETKIEIKRFSYCFVACACRDRGRLFCTSDDLVLVELSSSTLHIQGHAIASTISVPTPPPCPLITSMGL